MNRRSALFVILIFAVGLVAGIAVKAVFFSEPIVERAAETAPAPQSRQQLLDEADITATDIELVQGKEGAMTWKLLASEAKYNQEKKLIGVVRPQLTAFYGTHRQEVYVKADRGEVDQKNDNLTLYDNVAGRFGDLELEAQHLDYVGAINKVYLKGGVTIRRPDMTFSAVAVEIDLVSYEIVAAGGVKALLATTDFEENPFSR
ncbi:LPS export ABC transporter periplasmic protein LptC [Pseudodesulfovibrio sp.]|uniref:LPS export ABC transporter periplasmic protein LptC n=1 Tax=Pseudodesulfovibrio sp. TaxID=2035812 RepID=UPI0026160DE9|nr:LPS export ABC transporter periplasmic protein LptC [Pseudodesulfovibrio sp.]MDD3313602.1 LPS export ABC transporter periplasmic protein LptC [Pseudodesulfovibrio sp.]